MTETVVLQIPEALYQRLAIAAGATQRSFFLFTSFFPFA
jgi:hypothetical protein